MERKKEAKGKEGRKGKEGGGDRMEEEEEEGTIPGRGLLLKTKDLKKKKSSPATSHFFFFFFFFFPFSFLAAPWYTRPGIRSEPQLRPELDSLTHCARQGSNLDPGAASETLLISRKPARTPSLHFRKLALLPCAVRAMPSGNKAPSSVGWRV